MKWGCQQCHSTYQKAQAKGDYFKGDQELVSTSQAAVGLHCSSLPYHLFPRGGGKCKY